MADPPSVIEVALCQYELQGASSMDRLLKRMASMVDKAPSADLFVFPELVTTDLVNDPAASVSDTALDPNQEAQFQDFVGQLASDRDATIVGGSYNVIDAGELSNRAAIAHPDGRITRYDKQHLTPAERAAGKRAGSSATSAIEVNGARVATAICYDVEFPRTVRGFADDGAEVLVVPSWTRTSAGYQRVRRCAAARAVENQLYVVYVPLVGSHLTEEWAATGRGTVFAPCDDVVGPHGTRLSLPRDEHAVGSTSLDLSELRESRQSAEVRPHTDYRERISSNSPR